MVEAFSWVEILKVGGIPALVVLAWFLTSEREGKRNAANFQMALNSQKETFDTVMKAYKQREEHQFSVLQEMLTTQKAQIVQLSRIEEDVKRIDRRSNSNHR